LYRRVKFRKEQVHIYGTRGQLQFSQIS